MNDTPNTTQVIDVKFNSIEEAKAAGQFYRKGHIIPRRVAKTDRKSQHRLRFGSDAWVIRAPRGQLVMCDSPGGSAVEIVGRLVGNLHVYGAPYQQPDGQVAFMGHCGISDEDWLANINQTAYELGVV